MSCRGSFVMFLSRLEVILNSKILANYFKELCGNYVSSHDKNNVWINQQRITFTEKMIHFLTQTGRLIQEEKADAEIFKDEIKRICDLNILKLEILWYLQTAKLLALTDYFQYHEHKENGVIIDHISSQIFENILEYQPSMSKVRKAMVIDLTKALFQCSKSSILNQKNSFYKTEMNLIAENLNQQFNCLGNSYDKYLEIPHLMELFHCSELDRNALKLFFQHMLTTLFKSFRLTYKSVFKKQEKTKNQVQNKKIYQLFIAISKILDINFFVAELQAKLINTSRDINWDHMFCLITFIGVTYKEGWRKLKALSNYLLKLSFKDLDTKLLSYVFLIARQGCFDKANNYFPSYLQWFASTISSESKLVNSKKVCNFLFDFLTELIPYDSPYYLKVHINKAPCVPADCHSILNNYVALVKIQLNKLNVSIELGICENFTTESAPSFDVENVMKHFQKTNDILNSVFHASMFCKDYYEKKFLVELLKKFEGEKSIRHKLILKLHSLGKIPNSMFKVYKTLGKEQFNN